MTELVTREEAIERFCPDEKCKALRCRMARTLVHLYDTYEKPEPKPEE